MIPTTLLVALLLAADSPTCTSNAQCNRLGSEALKAGRSAEALTLFEQQVDFADTALVDAADEAARPRLVHAREIALNNAALASLRGGNCLLARLWLQAADPAHKATRANRREVDASCGERPAGSDSRTGEFRQYVGHGAFNSLSLRETGDETLRLDAFWMRIGRGPLSTYGLAAFGQLEQVYLHVDGTHARGRFEGLDPAIACEVSVQWVDDGLDIRHTDAPDCRVGGAGAELNGRYWRIGEAAELNDAEQ